MRTKIIVHVLKFSKQSNFYLCLLLCWCDFQLKQIVRFTMGTSLNKNLILLYKLCYNLNKAIAFQYVLSSLCDEFKVDDGFKIFHERIWILWLYITWIMQPASLVSKLTDDCIVTFLIRALLILIFYNNWNMVKCILNF